MGMTSVILGASLGIAADALVILTFTSMLYYILVVVASLAVSRGRQLRGTRPRASVLVPLCGIHQSLRANLEAFRATLGPGDELLIGATRPDDPAIALARKVFEYDERVRIVAGSSSDATNPKVATLVALERLATHDIIVLVDSDVRLDIALLDGLVSPLADPRTGLATALYRGVPSGSFASHLEALWINMDFVPSVLVSHLFSGGIDFALGAANAVRREVLTAIGGIATLGEVLADDHVLGKRVSQAGYRVTIASVCVPIWLDSSLNETLARLLRWCRTYRACQPVGYAATLISHHGVACAALALGLAALGVGSVRPAAILLAGVLVVRMSSGLVAHRVLAGRDADIRDLPLLGVRDLVGSALFVAAWSGRGVTWRGARYRVAPDGTLHRRAPGPTGAARRPVAP
jgi:ceramide glucosyltransferase